MGLCKNTWKYGVFHINYMMLHLKICGIFFPWWELANKRKKNSFWIVVFIWSDLTHTIYFELIYNLFNFNLKYLIFHFVSHCIGNNDKSRKMHNVNYFEIIYAYIIYNILREWSSFISWGGQFKFCWHPPPPPSPPYLYEPHNDPPLNDVS